LAGQARRFYLVDLPAESAPPRSRAGALLAHDTSKELLPEEIPLIGNARLLQSPPPASIGCRPAPAARVAGRRQQGRRHRADVGAHRRAGARRREAAVHRARQPKCGNQPGSANKMLRGGICGILGFGTSGLRRRLLRASACKSTRIKRRGASDEPTD
jgi:hypothetical protein